MKDPKTVRIVVLAMVIVYVMSIMVILYGLVFVSQPMTQAPNDKDFIAILTTLLTFLTGSLSGYLTANGVNQPQKPTPKKRSVKREQKIPSDLS